MYNELFADTSLEVGKTLSKGERDEKNLNHEKVRVDRIMLSVDYEEMSNQSCRNTCVFLIYQVYGLTIKCTEYSCEMLTY